MAIGFLDCMLIGVILIVLAIPWIIYGVSWGRIPENVIVEGAKNGPVYRPKSRLLVDQGILSAVVLLFIIKNPCWSLPLVDDGRMLLMKWVTQGSALWLSLTGGVGLWNTLNFVLTGQRPRVRFEYVLLVVFVVLAAVPAYLYTEHRLDLSSVRTHPLRLEPPAPRAAG